MEKIGFMQGRLSPLVESRIQAFPWDHWESEFPLAASAGFELIEWTLDDERLYENPLMTGEGQIQIAALREESGVVVASLTGDCFMQRPFWKADPHGYHQGERDLLAIATACHTVGISQIVVPLVDNGNLENQDQEKVLVETLGRHVDTFRDLGLGIAFESDLGPIELLNFLDRFDSSIVGINYDIGNSASLGYRPAEELGAYGSRVTNVHVKDRKYGGPSVPLGEGCADFQSVFDQLDEVGYDGNYILQTARSSSGDHIGALCMYRDLTSAWIESSER